MYVDLVGCFQWGVVGFACVLSTHLLIFALQMHVYEHENFQGRTIEITGECINVCDLGMDKVRSLRVECGP